MVRLRASLVAPLSWLAGCSEIIVLGSECPGLSGPCPSGDAAVRQPADAARGGELDAAPELDAEVDADAQVCASPSSNEPACECVAVAPERILSHWTLDERSGSTASEATGKGPNGALQNFADEAPWASGNIAGALSFDGVDDQVQVGAVPGEVRTLSLWLRPDTTQVVTRRTAVQPPSSHGPLEEWLDPQNAYADDNSFATAGSLIGGTIEQHWGGFHLADHLPRGAEIQGITVTVDTGNLGVLGGFVVELSWDGGISHTSSRYGWGQLIIGSDQRQAGGPDRLWGGAWTQADFTDANFRVLGSFGGIANAMALDFLGVEVTYLEQATPRTILTLSPVTGVAFSGPDSKEVVASGWPDSAVYVNGSLDGSLVDDWNHVAVVGATGVAASEVLLGRAPAAEQLSFPYQGLMDDVLLFDEALTAAQVRALYEQLTDTQGCPTPLPSQSSPPPAAQ